MTDQQKAEESIRVAIVDDHRLLAEALSMALAAEGIHVVVPSLSPPDTLPGRIVDSRPDLVLLDLDLGAAGHGSRLVRPLVAAGVRVLLMTGSTDLEQVAGSVEDGAVGVIRKDGPLVELVRNAAGAARAREVMTPRDRLGILDAARACRERRMAVLAPFGQLTGRESEVLRDLTEGRNVAEIARRAVVAEATVRSQVRCILTKLGVRSQLEAVAAARRSGWS